MRLPDDQQLNLFVHSDSAMARAYRIAAETARRDPNFTPDEGERRARAYESQAQQYESRSNP